jgi:transcriptional regulator with PAS, ATPase and Fis domain
MPVIVPEEKMVEPILEQLVATIPLVQELLIEDVGFAINSVDTNVAYFPGRALKIYSKTSYEIRPGDPMHPGLMGYKAVRENRRLVANIEAGKSVYGIPYTVVALPIHDEAGQTVGSLVMVFVRKLADYKKEPRLFSAKYDLDDVIGSGELMTACKARARRIARSSSTVLILGETGVGKELFAHAIHKESSRQTGPFVRVNCAAIPEALLEAELFGYEEGSFTGARKGGQVGKFEQAEGGTIFLDEIGDMPFNMQAKLLRILQEREFERIGGKGVKQVNMRIVAATNADLETLIRNGRFRSDLFYRLNVLTLTIPPLREHPQDIPDYIEHFRSIFLREHGFSTSLSPECVAALSNYDWPGNIRELGSIVEKVMFEAEGRTATLDDLPRHIAELANRKTPSRSPETCLIAKLEQFEKEEIRKALAVCNGNRTEAADHLQIARIRLYRKLKKYKLS